MSVPEGVEPLVRPAWMADADFDLIERFVIAFNRVDRYLRDLYRADERMSFGRLVEIHLRKNPHWRDADALRAFKAVRNVMIHERDLPYHYLFVPTRGAVEEIERIRDRLVSPERLIPKFQRHVWTLEAGDGAARLLGLIHEHHCTKFPVYEADRFRGLLTETGIARWLAAQTAAAGPLLDLGLTKVGGILAAEEDGRNVEFLSAACTTDDLLRSFSVNPALQAVLITDDGRDWHRPLGIATRTDALRLLGNGRSG